MFNPFIAGRIKEFAGIPGPKPAPLLGNAGALNKPNPQTAFLKWGDEFIGLFRIWILWQPWLVLGDPDLIEEVLVRRREDFYKKRPVQALTPILTDIAPFLGNLPTWPEVSAKDLPALPNWHQWLAASLPVMRQTVREHVAKLAAPDAGYADAADTIRRLGFAVWSQTVVGEELGDDALDDLMTLSAIGQDRMGQILTDPKPTIDDKRFEPAWNGWHGRLVALVEKAKAHPDPSRTDLLWYALQAPTPLDTKDLAVALGNVFFGGLFSSTTGLDVALWMLTQHADVKAKVEAELGPVCAGEYDWKALMGAGYTDSVVRESLRMYPPVPVFMRSTAKDREVQLGGHTIPANTSMFISPPAIQRSARFWPEPMTFKPDRWTDEVKEKNPYNSRVFFPFGRGPRSCSGEAMALLFIHVALAEIVTNFGFEVGMGKPWNPETVFAVSAPKDWSCRFSAKG